MEVKGESTIVIENKLSQKKVDETKTQILNTINNLNGTYGVLSEDLNGSYSLGISENQQFEGASFFKLPLAIAVYEKSEKANFNLDDTYVLNDADKMLGAGILVGIPSGTSISYRDILKALLNNSDNTAFNILYNQVGGNAVQEVIDQIGMTNTSYADSLTTPADIALLFKKLMNGKLINDTSKQEMLGFLTKTDYESFLPAAFVTPWANCGMPTPVPGELGHGRGPIGANCAETIVVTQEQIGSVDEANMPPTLCPNLVSETQIMIDGLDAKRKLWGADSPDKKIRCYEVWIYKDKKPILLWASSIGPDTDTNNINKLILTLDQILSTFKFTNKNQTTCILRPACLDSNPRCLIAEPISGWCK